MYLYIYNLIIVKVLFGVNVFYFGFEKFQQVYLKKCKIEGKYYSLIVYFFVFDLKKIR